MWRRNSAHDCTVLHCTEPFIVIFPSSRYNLDEIKRDVKAPKYRHFQLLTSVSGLLFFFSFKFTLDINVSLCIYKLYMPLECIRVLLN